jgi:uncharacterized protein (TIGR02246 family)
MKTIELRRIGWIGAFLLALAPLPVAGQVLPIQQGITNEHQLYTAETMVEYQELVREWGTAWSNGNAARVARLYADNAVFVPVGGEIVQGRANIERAVRGLVSEWSNLQMGLTDFEVRGNILYGLGMYSYIAHENGTASNVNGTYIVVMQRSGRSWRIRSQVFSPAAG